jgi:hypothetical protein
MKDLKEAKNQVNPCFCLIQVDFKSTLQRIALVKHETELLDIV